MTENDILNRIRTAYEHILGDDLVGIYVHGSLAFGCYRFACSDIDFLVVVKTPPAPHAKQAMIDTLLQLEPICPPKGLEMSVVTESVCRPFVYPTPYELHYSASYRERARADLAKYCDDLHGTDKDLAAHFTVTRRVGFPLCGKPVAEVFGEVPREAYLDSIRYDIENAVDDIREDPVYIILNLCRVLAYLRDDAVISKKDGGLWGIAHLPPKYVPLVRAALDAYTESTPYIPDPPTEQAFAADMLAHIFPDQTQRSGE